mmetsp:Transcript_19219/g.31921  ORF Transcript_19219/g.31921 Transcript_19219/m.31921 type:complete len:342 (+) Transcript_19219:109-1134(+)
MLHRLLTFLDPDDGPLPNDTAGFIVAFSILSVASFISVLQGLWETSRTQYLYDRYSLKILFPWASFVQCIENATLAYDVSGGQIADGWAYIVYALQATVPPCLFLSTFDITYSIHKTRSIAFCGIVDGHTRTKNPRVVKFLKWATRFIALGLLAIGLVVNFNLVTPVNPLAGRVGWYYLVTVPWTDESLHVLLGILPIGIASLASFYFSAALWRYGTTYSMVVHASPFNPWFSPFFGTIALVGGQWFDSRWFPLLSNLGIFVFVESILLLFMEVNKDMHAATELVDFLDTIGSKRDDKVAEQKQGAEETNEEERGGHVELAQSPPADPQGDDTSSDTSINV